MTGDGGTETPIPSHQRRAQSTAGEGLTPAQAAQLLEAIGQNTETLQERLQRVYVAPGAYPQKDW
ncbi:MAG: hypothetical protein R3E31_16485 [Chloroflexota bacterium]